MYMYVCTCRVGRVDRRALNSKSKRTSFPQKLAERHRRKRLKLGLGTDQIVNTDTTGFLSIRRPFSHSPPISLCCSHPSVRDLPATRHFCSPPPKTRRRTSSFTRSEGKGTHTRNKKDYERKREEKRNTHLV